MPESKLSPGRPLAPAIPLLRLEVVTPRGLALEDDVDEVIAPAAHGELGVLPFHRPFLASLKAGSIRWRHGVEWREAAVGAGFLEVGPDKVIVLCDEYLAQKEIDAEEAKADLRGADEALEAFDGDTSSPAYEELERKRAWASARVGVVSRRPMRV